MKTIFNLSALSLLALTSAHAADETQYIDCHFLNSESNDHIIISLKDPQNGTFFYTAGLDQDGESQNTGKLFITRVEDSKNNPAKKDTAQFSAKWNTDQDGGTVTIEFLFSMPKALVFKTSNSFKAGLQTNIADNLIASTSKNSKPFSLSSDDDLNCFARLYPKN